MTSNELLGKVLAVVLGDSTQVGDGGGLSNCGPDLGNDSSVVVVRSVSDTIGDHGSGKIECLVVVNGLVLDPHACLQCGACYIITVGPPKLSCYPSSGSSKNLISNQISFTLPIIQFPLSFCPLPFILILSCFLILLLENEPIQSKYPLVM